MKMLFHHYSLPHPLSLKFLRENKPHKFFHFHLWVVTSWRIIFPFLFYSNSLLYTYHPQRAHHGRFPESFTQIQRISEIQCTKTWANSRLSLCETCKPKSLSLIKLEASLYSYRILFLPLLLSMTLS